MTYCFLNTFSRRRSRVMKIAVVKKYLNESVKSLDGGAYFRIVIFLNSSALRRFQKARDGIFNIDSNYRVHASMTRPDD